MSFRWKTAKAGALLFIAVATLIAFTYVAYGDESATCRFTGKVTIDDAGVPAGTVVKAIIGGDEYVTVTPEGWGPSTYSIAIHPLEGIEYSDGTEVSFTINGIPADQTGTVQLGKNIRRDLTASSINAPPSSSGLPGSPVSAASTSVWLIVGLVFSCIVEVSLVAGVAGIFVRYWNS